MTAALAIAALVSFVAAVTTSQLARQNLATGLRRWVPRTMGILGALLAVTAFVLSTTAGPVWDEAENSISSLPIPDGYTDTGLSRRGDSNCNWNPSCTSPSVTRTLRPIPPRSRRDSCDTLHRILTSWISKGYTFDRWNESGSDSLLCNLAGSMNGLNVGADVSDNGDIRLSALAIRK
jgi:hypothetical protein